MERFSFYERAKKAYAVVATGESALYANILLKKRVITVEERTRASSSAMGPMPLTTSSSASTR